MANSAGLTGLSTAGDIHANVILGDALGDRQRLRRIGAQRFSWEIVFKSAAVDRDFAGAGGETHAGHSGLAAAGAKEFLSLGSHRDYYLIFNGAGIWAACGCSAPW